MRKFGLDAKRMPTLELRDRAAGHVARLEPRGLWIIGSNGRVDLKDGSQRYLIVDTAENFEAPDWQAARADRRYDPGGRYARLAEARPAVRDLEAIAAASFLQVDHSLGLPMATCAPKASMSRR